MSDEKAQDETLDDITTQSDVEITDESEKKESETEEQKEAKKLLNIEKSRLGTRLAKLEDLVNDRIERLEQMLSTMVEGKKNGGGDDAEIGDDDILTKKDMLKLLATMQNQQQETISKYEKSYLAHLRTLGTDDEMFDDVLALMDAESKKYNITYSGHKDPSADAERNYYKAKTALLQNGKPVKIKGEKSKLPIGVGSSQKMKEPEAKNVALDDMAQEFLKSIGKENDKEFVERALKA